MLVGETVMGLGRGQGLLSMISFGFCDVHISPVRRRKPLSRRFRWQVAGIGQKR